MEQNFSASEMSDMAVVTSEECLERAIRHVSEAWLPPHPEILESIRNNLRSGAYVADRASLSKDLKRDVALYTYCLKELNLLLNSEQKLGSANVLLQASDADLLQVLDRQANQISTHSIEDITEFQALRFRESLLSASTAEVLAEQAQLDSEIGFSCALLRQLGLALIAWNYPRVYARALEKLSAGTTLDASLKKVLGFSPSILALSLARRWNIADDVLIALGERTALKDRVISTELKVGETLQKICEVGEALARANDPDHYPSALSDWESAQEAIAAKLGPTGMQKILERAQDLLHQYAARSPEVTGFASSENVKESIRDSQYAVRLFEKNTHLRALPEDLRQQVRKLYSKFRPNKIFKTNIRTVIDEVIPQAGFFAGCIYLYDPEKRALCPAIKIGDPPLERLKAVRISSVLSQYDLIASAYSLKTPLREESLGPRGERCISIVASLGQATPVGVVYLEIREDMQIRTGVDGMAAFRAIRQIFSDCMNLL